MRPQEPADQQANCPGAHQPTGAAWSLCSKLWETSEKFLASGRGSLPDFMGQNEKQCPGTGAGIPPGSETSGFVSLKEAAVVLQAGLGVFIASYALQVQELLWEIRKTLKILHLWATSCCWELPLQRQGAGDHLHRANKKNKNWNAPETTESAAEPEEQLLQLKRSLRTSWVTADRWWLLRAAALQSISQEISFTQVSSHHNKPETNPFS